MTAALSLPHRIWRTLPRGLRRAALHRASAALAPHPDPAPPPPSDGVAVAGELSRASGLGEGARLMIAALGSLGIPAYAFDAGDLAGPAPRQASDPAASLPRAAPLVVHADAPSLPGTLRRLPRSAVQGRRVIGYWAWELPVASPAWRHGVPFVHEIWTPSHFAAEALRPIAAGRPVRVVPHPVAVRPPRPAALTRADFGVRDGVLLVLTSFSLASSFERKNPLAAIAAFKAAFGNSEQALLILKAGHADAWPRDLAVLQDAASGAPNIRIETRTLPEADSHALTREADIVLSLHRSEGFGLVPAEAMLLGRCIAATGWSATAEFLTPANSVPVRYGLIPARDPRGVFEAPGALWADADVADAAQHLSALAASPETRRALGEAARRDALARFTADPLREALLAAGYPDLPAQAA